MPLDRRVFDAQALMSEHPPVWRHPNKQVVFEVACPAGCVHEGPVAYTRWRAMALPERVDPVRASARAVARADIYDYVPVLSPGSVEWHVNFADPDLFVAYGSGLFAQDEMQVAEHPILGALRERLKAAGLSARTAEGGHPTPVLVTGVQRRCRIDTARRPDRAHGLYGNAFAAAPAEVVRAATSRIDPPTISNVIAMAAPAYGRGRYTAREIEGILATAFTGFRAAVMESGDAPVAVHTGFWGCGAFGGNRVLMALLQIFAGELAGIERLVFHTVDQQGRAAFDSAASMLGGALRDTVDVAELPGRVAALGLCWGTSNGT